MELEPTDETSLANLTQHKIISVRFGGFSSVRTKPSRHVRCERIQHDAGGPLGKICFEKSHGLKNSIDCGEPRDLLNLSCSYLSPPYIGERSLKVVGPRCRSTSIAYPGSFPAFLSYGGLTGRPLRVRVTQYTDMILQPDLQWLPRSSSRCRWAPLNQLDGFLTRFADIYERELTD